MGSNFYFKENVSEKIEIWSVQGSWKLRLNSEKLDFVRRSKRKFTVEFQKAEFCP